MDNMLMAVRCGIGGCIVVVVATSAHLWRCDGTLVAMHRLQHLLEGARVDMHVLGALRLVPLARCDLMLVHDVLVVVL